jgi:hypothetical protein
MDPSRLLGFSTDDPKHGSGADEHQHQRAENAGTENKRTGHNRSQIFDETQCLENLSKLVGLLAMGLVKPAPGNAIRAALTEILRHHRKSGRDGGQCALSDDNVLEILRRDPTTLNLLGSLLTPDQVDLVMREATDGHE